MGSEEGSLGARAIRVGEGRDRLGQRRAVFGFLPMDVKVTSSDTGGGLLVLQQVDARRGGPPRHIHRNQDEWFYVVAGNYVVEVGGERFPLRRGDSLLAPRGVPHTWAHVGTTTGEMLIGFTPAGDMEAFFAEATRLEGVPTGPDLELLFRRHGMDVVGPPLEVG